MDPAFVQVPATLDPTGAAPALAVRAPALAGRAPRRGVVVAMAGDAKSSTWDEYVKRRQAGGLHGGTIEDAQGNLQTFIEGGGDMEFDGGDSGGGVVGDGNTDLEDQHNAPEMLREGFGKEGAKSPKGPKVKGAVEARVASAGQNYFGRTTGYAEKKIKEITEDDRKTHRLDNVRAQQLENWHNQRAIHQTKQSRQGPFQPYQPPTRFQSRAPVQTPGDRRDGEDWPELVVDPSEQPTETFEVRTTIDNTHTTDIVVRNPFLTFAPFRCVFTHDSHPAFHVTPERGTMERRNGDPIDVVVRFSPRELMGNATATLVFETEDFRNIYKFIGST